MLLFTVLFIDGCSQPSNAPVSERPEKKAKKAVEKTITAPRPETTMAEETTYVASDAATASPNPVISCRILAYVADENMSEAEAAEFSEEIAQRMVDDMEAGGHKDMGDVMDDMGVPAYEEECGG